jgi:hypothetical protein
MDDTEIDRCVGVLLSYWPSPEQTQGEVLALNQVLERYDIRDFDRTLNLLLTQGRQFRPAPGELAPLVRDSHRFLNEPDPQPALPGDEVANVGQNMSGLQAAAAALAESQRRRAAEAMGDAPPRSLVDDEYSIWDDPPEDPRNVLYKCWTCKDTGFKELSSAGQTTVKPCPECRPKQHALWAKGAFNPDWRGRPNDLQRKRLVEQIGIDDPK